jgi:hypothetical protein
MSIMAIETKTVETKTVVLNGVKIIMQRCWNHADKQCKGWFLQSKSGCKGHRYSCSDRCAMKKCPSWMNRNKKKAKRG